MTNIGSRKVGSHYGQKKEGIKWWHGLNFFSGIDIFSKELPSFNLQGETHIGTNYGGVCTLIVWLLTFAYALIRLEFLILKKDPNINFVTELNIFDETDVLNLQEKGYRIAFVLEDYNLRETKGKEEYIRYVAQIWHEVDGVEKFTNIPLHPCTQEELEIDFYEIVPTSKTKLEMIQGQE